MAEKTKILVLGSGMVAPPCIEYLTRNSRNDITVGSLSSSMPHARFCPGPCVWIPENQNFLVLDVSSLSDLDAQVAAHDLVISLIPYAYHAAVIRSAIKGKTNVVTTSYISPEMRSLDDAVKKAGITVLNEVGVVTGIDHLYAIKTIDEVHEKGGNVLEFHSFCGGLPAPECADNPLGFKFSWSPRGALISQLNSATFLQQGEQIDIPSSELMTTAKPYYIVNGYPLVAYPNRNSVPFREFYGIPEADTVVRGSLRYKGNPGFVQALAILGWFDQEPKAWLEPEVTWAQIQQNLIGASDSDKGTIIARIKEIHTFPDQAESERIISGMDELGLFSAEPATICERNVFDTLCHRLSKLLSFQPGERDLVLLQHKFVVEWKDGKKDTITSTLELLGDPKRYSAMALSVGATCGVATQLLLDGHPALNRPGVLAPYIKDICDPIREGVAREGVELVEQVL